ncbi:hypothetical protein PC121_g13797 [Phytophthora cactorum]|nr:hypothetical protein PC120_g12336 [Phytophthora cactorum]KAG3059815.1 hypothetical protein PC121_g13797 [Phytophthora cactorum]KAG4058145.1 hypothetical protein PC123_g6878 [Phytophthora cactorum]
MRTSPDPAPRARTHTFRPRADFVLARWPCQVAHLREQYNPLGAVFLDVQHFRSCGCASPCRAGTCANSLMQLYCNINCCPYGGQCGNGLVESDKVYLARNVQPRALGVVAAETIEAGEVLGQYLGELEHVSLLRAKRPTNMGYRLLMTQRPDRPTHPICVAINAERFGSLMRFVNYSCHPCARFVEVSNGHRTTVVVVTTELVQKGEEIFAAYGDDLWFVCRCELPGCHHSGIQEGHASVV